MGGIEALVEVQNLYYEPDKYIIDELWDDLLTGLVNVIKNFLLWKELPNDGVLKVPMMERF